MAHWIQPNKYDYPFCSDCGAECLTDQDYECLSPFCPNCGSPMSTTRNYVKRVSSYWEGRKIYSCDCEDFQDCEGKGLTSSCLELHCPHLKEVKIGG